MVVLGNHEDRVWSKNNGYAPLLRGDLLHFLVILAAKKQRPLCQGDCKNAFCHSILPPDKTTIVHPPHGDPKADPKKYWLLFKTLYGLRRSPHNWHDKINAILISIGLTPSFQDPCLYLDFIRDPLSLLLPHPTTLSFSVSTWTILSISPKIRWSKLYSIISLPTAR